MIVAVILVAWKLVQVKQANLELIWYWEDLLMPRTAPFIRGGDDRRPSSDHWCFWRLPSTCTPIVHYHAQAASGKMQLVSELLHENTHYSMLRELDYCGTEQSARTHMQQFLERGNVFHSTLEWSFLSASNFEYSTMIVSQGNTHVLYCCQRNSFSSLWWQDLSSLSTRKIFVKKVSSTAPGVLHWMKMATADVENLPEMNKSMIFCHMPQILLLVIEQSWPSLRTPRMWMALMGSL